MKTTPYPAQSAYFNFFQIPYLSQNDGDLHFGLGEDGAMVDPTVRWPDGIEETHTGIAPDRLVELTHVASYPERPAAGAGN